MNIWFRVTFSSVWGQQLYVSGSSKALGQWQPEAALALSYCDTEHWQSNSLIFNNEYIEYKYFIRQADGNIIWEEGCNRTLNSLSTNELIVIDCFRNDFNAHERLFNNLHSNKTFNNLFEKDLGIDYIQFALSNSLLTAHKNIGIVGNCEILGNWHKPIPLLNENGNEVSWRFNKNELQNQIEYKYVLIDPANGQIAEWEEGNNRCLNFDLSGSYLIHDSALRLSFAPWRGAGVAVPVFSLRNADSFGIGDFLGLKQLSDWCRRSGLQIVQLLPVNDTTTLHGWDDSYPYKAISATALHPIYLNLNALGRLHQHKLQQHFDAMAGTLNQNIFVDYPAVSQAKWDFFRLIYAQNRQSTIEQNDYRDFVNRNEEWLKPYAAFCYLRDTYQTADFGRWGNYSKFDEHKIGTLINDKPFETGLYYYLQYHLDKQLREAVEYAHRQDVALKGDIAIGISPHSVEAWSQPALFNLETQAGAPPDDFAVMGQNWGFPTYNWEEMAHDNYKWWRKRLQHMAGYFDAFRIDHILGFFRIWEIAIENRHGLLGYFNPAMPYSLDELQTSGLQFNEKMFTQPYLKESYIEFIFNDKAKEIKQKFLTKNKNGYFTFNPQYNTQQKIAIYFENNKNCESEAIKEKLMLLLDEVVFIKDKKQEGFHPRFNLHKTQIFNTLDKEQQNILMRLHNDYFFHRHNDFWKQNAMEKLPVIVKASNMLACGEDLGLVPDSVPEVMRYLNILSLEVQRMPKQQGRTFVNPAENPYLSVDTTSTHDMSTLRGWWIENREVSIDFYHNLLQHNNDAPEELTADLAREIIEQHLQSPSMLVILPLQDWFTLDSGLPHLAAKDEQINVPANEHNQWKYRMPVPLEDLCQNELFIRTLSTLIKNNHRNANN